MDFIKFLLVLTLVSIIPGQLIRIPIAKTAVFTISDLTVLLLIVAALIYKLTVTKTLKIPRGIFTILLVFSLLAATSTILAISKFAPTQIMAAGLFQIRFLAYFLISIVTLNIIGKDQIQKWLNLVCAIGVVFATIGFVQFILVPDLSFLTPFGWDPHQKRLVSSFLDPNFTGGALVIFASITTPLFLFKKKPIYLAATIFYFIAIILTFSRSSYLALLVFLIITGIAKSPKFLGSFLALFALVILINAQARARIIGAFSIDETVESRLESYKKALAVFGKNPVFGVGFNTYRYAQSQYGFFSTDEPLGGHSGAGSDSSILLVAATTGFVGLTAFVLFILAVAKTLTSCYKSFFGLAALCSFAAILVHSQFVNSFFYPQIIILIWFLVGLSYVSDS